MEWAFQCKFYCPWIDAGGTESEGALVDRKETGGGIPGRKGVHNGRRVTAEESPYVQEMQPWEGEIGWA